MNIRFRENDTNSGRNVSLWNQNSPSCQMKHSWLLYLSPQGSQVLLPPGSIWQGLNTFLVVITEEHSCQPVSRRSRTSHIAQDSAPRTKNSSAPDVPEAKTGKLCSRSRHQPGDSDSLSQLIIYESRGVTLKHFLSLHCLFLASRKTTHNVLIQKPPNRLQHSSISNFLVPNIFHSCLPRIITTST